MKAERPLQEAFRAVSCKFGKIDWVQFASSYGLLSISGLPRGQEGWTMGSLIARNIVLKNEPMSLLLSGKS